MRKLLKKNIRGILLISILLQIAFCSPIYTQEANSYLETTNQEDTLRTIGKAVETGIMYKELYKTEVNSHRMLDSLLKICYERPIPTKIEVEYKTNWVLTTAIVILAQLATWAIYLSITK